tara:strand:+ start:158 stop:448 length:291 start_codon:yes stop_codon:yes gene_type:complete
MYDGDQRQGQLTYQQAYNGLCDQRDIILDQDLEAEAKTEALKQFVRKTIPQTAARISDSNNGLSMGKLTDRVSNVDLLIVGLKIPLLLPELTHSKF